MVKVCLCVKTGTYGKLTDEPADATLYPGGSLRLNCSSDIDDPVVWWLTKEGSTVRQQVTSGGELTTDFTDLFTIYASSLYDLVATNTSDTESYCGAYECVDENGVGETANATVSSKHSQYS